MLDQIRSRGNADVLLATFNYDRLLEFAVTFDPLEYGCSRYVELRAGDDVFRG